MDAKCAIYVRQSLDRTGDGHAVERQQEDCEALARYRGWAVAEVLRDNDISASGRKRRPGFERLLELIEQRQVSAVVSWDLTRLTRNARDTLRLLEAGQRAGATVALVKGSDLNLGTADGRTLAGILASIAQGEIDKKSERQIRAALQRAEDGRVPTGTRLTGYTVHGEVIEAEAAIVRELFSRFAAGDSLYGLVTWLTETGVPTRNGGRWLASTVQGILRNPRYAGRSGYGGKANDGPDLRRREKVVVAQGTWPAIIKPEIFDQVADRLADPRRVTNRAGTDRKHLGAGLFRCAVCDGTCSSFSGQRYRCREAHVSRSRTSIDAFVIKLVRARLARPDLADLLPRTDSAEMARLSGEITRLEGRIRRIEADYDAELIDGRRYKIATEKAAAELATARSARARLTTPGVASGVLAANDPVAAFDAAPLMIRRSVIEALATVRIGPAPRGRRSFDPWTLGTSQWTGDARTWAEIWTAEKEEVGMSAKDSATITASSFPSSRPVSL